VELTRIITVPALVELFGAPGQSTPFVQHVSAYPESMQLVPAAQYAPLPQHMPPAAAQVKTQPKAKSPPIWHKSQSLPGSQRYPQFSTVGSLGGALGQFAPLNEVALRGSAQYWIWASERERVRIGKAEMTRRGMRKLSIFKDINLKNKLVERKKDNKKLVVWRVVVKCI